jgi:hypothetical protein
MKLVSIFAIAAIAATPLAAQETDAEWRAWLPQPDEIEMPQLAFEETAEDIKNYDKYYYFNREGASFAEALADIRQCDEHARGLFGGDYYPDPGYAASYGLGGVIGGAIGAAMADAIYGSAERRRKRRVNMRRCMFFMGYERYGLSKQLWEQFNFEEGNSDIAEDERQHMLARQAKAASGPKPQAEGIGL